MRAMAHRHGIDEMRFAGEAIVWLYAAIVLAIALFWEGRTLATSAWEGSPSRAWDLGIAAAIAMFATAGVANFVVYVALHRPPHAAQQAAAIVGGSLPFALALALRAGVVEELFYRGLAIEQLTVFTGRRWLSAAIATTVFVLAHALVFDWVQLVPIATVSIVLVVLYLWRRDLWANMIAHLTVDTVGLVYVAFHAHDLAH